MNSKNKIAKSKNFHNTSFYYYQLIISNFSLIPENLLKTLFALAKYMPNSYPKIETIALITGQSTRTVMRKIAKLEELKIISVMRNHRKSNSYALLLSDNIVSPKDDSLGCQLEHSRVTNFDSRVTTVTLLGDNMVSPQHINKHINSKHINKHIDDPEIKELAEEWNRRKSNIFKSV